MPPLALNRALIRVSGPEARAYLQGLLTQNLDRLGAAPVYGGLLSPQGKVIADMILWPVGDEGVLIEADPAHGADLLRRLTLYKLRAQVTIEDIADAYTILFSPKMFPGAQPDPRFPNGALGWRDAAPKEAIAFEDGAAAFKARRIALGAPDLSVDAAPEEVFALEALFEECNGVDFQKGCFVGQENVSRMKRRATTRKKFCPIVFDGEAPAFGTVVRAGEAEIGTVRSGAPGRALALLRLDRALEAKAKGVELSVDGRAARLDPPPWLILPQGDAP
jgi:tRNA-modifying protein YgfZ